MSTHDPGPAAPLSAFVGAYHERLLRFAERRATCPRLAEDLVSHAYLVFLERASETADKDQVIAWAWDKDLLFDYCCKAIKFRLASYRRLERRRTSVPIERLADPPPQLRVQPARALDAARRCREVLQGLSEADARLLAARFLEGYSYADLSETRGVSPSTLRKRVSRAKRRAQANASRNAG